MTNIREVWRQAAADAKVHPLAGPMEVRRVVADAVAVAVGAEFRRYRPQHDNKCDVAKCAVCDQPHYWGHHAPEYRKFADWHQWQSKPCSCGLDALLAECAAPAEPLSAQDLEALQREAEADERAPAGPETEPERDINRCAVCGWPLAPTAHLGCRRGNCSERPLPKMLYDRERAVAEYGVTFPGSPLPIQFRAPAGAEQETVCESTGNELVAGSGSATNAASTITVPVAHGAGTHGLNDTTLSPAPETVTPPAQEPETPEQNGDDVCLCGDLRRDHDWKGCIACRENAHRQLFPVCVEFRPVMKAPNSVEPMDKRTLANDDCVRSEVELLKRAERAEAALKLPTPADVLVRPEIVAKRREVNIIVRDLQAKGYNGQQTLKGYIESLDQLLTLTVSLAQHGRTDQEPT